MDNTSEIIREALRHTEMHISDSLTLGLAANQRAMTFAGMSAAISALLTGLADNFPLASTMYLGAIGALIGAGIAIYSCSPRPFHINGHRWEHWKGHIDDLDSVDYVLTTQLEENDKRISFNFLELDRSARLFKLAILVTFLSISGPLLLGFCQTLHS